MMMVDKTKKDAFMQSLYHRAASKTRKSQLYYIVFGATYEIMNKELLVVTNLNELHQRD